MTNSLLQIRKLNDEDLHTLAQMETGIEDDYVVRIFPRLVNSPEHELYGLFEQNRMLSVAGYSIFAHHYAMLGRLRSDRRYLGKGNATELLTKIIDELKANPQIHWIGANTEEHNKPALKVLQKLGFPSYTPLYPVKLYEGETVEGKSGALWNKLTTKEEKRNILKLFGKSEFEVFPYQCYYPFPYADYLLSDDGLEQSVFYVNDDQSRFFIVKEDQKKEIYAMVMYPWNDHFQQPGFWNTIMYSLENHFTEHRLWIDMTKEGLNNAEQLDKFEVLKPWILHGEWVKS
ncbi:GNAT family N-acetyltransferase [Salinibacillus xinjiangensis]|uniref:GNAT family N-acetyltransferase n=1 Tax=Salinibacillus xinjiangensis TaxID=1229268 RepID=A0A6G1X147_9BACI|nr:GNAT family N-acetyltransferase [Salinibacillus xinjiangensis]MRG84711.1 GNAT family N-acetyltransferase [Salinibacillus xinjiangensis]